VIKSNLEEGFENMVLKLKQIAPGILLDPKQDPRIAQVTERWAVGKGWDVEFTPAGQHDFRLGDGGRVIVRRVDAESVRVSWTDIDGRRRNSVISGAMDKPGRAAVAALKRKREADEISAVFGSLVSI
jgi:hypothetical protein